MRTIKIFAVPSHTTKERNSGVDFARIIQPMQHLNGYTDGEVEILTRVYDPIKDANLDWLKVTQEYDIVYLNYTVSAWSYAAMGAMARKNNRVIVYDLDDDLWNMLPDNSAYAVFKEGAEGRHNLTAMIQEADYITTTNRHLKNAITHNAKIYPEKVIVFPNYIDLSLYNHRPVFKDTFEVQLTHFGSTTHFISLQDQEFANGIDRLMHEYPNLTFKTIGAFIPKFKTRWGARYRHDFGHQDIYKWISDKYPPFMDETDIMVVPLADNVYNRSKSSIKFLEASSSIKPGVWQDIRQYEEVVEDGVNGFLADTEDKWYGSIKKLIEDKELRQQMGQEAFRTVVNDWQIQNHLNDYAEFFKKVVDKNTPKSVIA